MENRNNNVQSIVYGITILFGGLLLISNANRIIMEFIMEFSYWLIKFFSHQKEYLIILTIGTILGVLLGMLTIILTITIFVGLYDIGKAVIETARMLYNRDVDLFINDFGKYSTRIAILMMMIPYVSALIYVGNYIGVSLMFLAVGVAGMYRRRHYLQLLRRSEVDGKTSVPEMKGLEQ